jgi:ABC-type antimicrobial peptide transport system, ATPase component
MMIYKVTDMNKIYQNDAGAVNAIVGCNIEINEGECVCISGGRASGKTTLLRILGGLERPTSGEIFIKSNNITSCSDDELTILRRKEIGYLLQNNSLIPELNVHENVIIPAILAHKKYDKVYYQNLICKLNIKDIISSYPRQLTPWQIKCVIFARALINNPNIILLDEPTDLRQQIERDILEFLMNMVLDYQKTLIMVTNDAEIKLFASRIIKLKNGEIIENKQIPQHQKRLYRSADL